MRTIDNGGWTATKAAGRQTWEARKWVRSSIEFLENLRPFTATLKVPWKKIGWKKSGPARKTKAFGEMQRGQGGGR